MIDSTPRALQDRSVRARVFASLWLYVGFAGASAFAAAVLAWSNATVAWPTALALGVPGALLAAGAWWRGLAIVAHDEDTNDHDAAAAGTDARPVAMRGGPVRPAHAPRSFATVDTNPAVARNRSAACGR